MSRSRQNKRSRTRGESMVMVLVLLMVFMILGTSVLTAASAATGSASARLLDRQVYYYARSALDVLNTSLREGELGAALCDTALETLLPTAGTVGTGVLNPQIAFEDGVLPGLSFENCLLNYSGEAFVLSGTAAAPTEVFLRLRDVELTFDCKYLKTTYAVRVLYRYSGWAERVTVGTTDVWKWHGSWIVQQFG